MKTPFQQYRNILRNWRQTHPQQAHFSDEQIMEVILTNLSKSNPDRVQVIGTDEEGKTLWKIMPRSAAG